jgi:hypothetical protein
MTAHGKTDSEAALLTWTLRDLKPNKGHQRRDALTEITYSRDLDYISALMALLVSPLYPTQEVISVGLCSFYYI